MLKHLLVAILCATIGGIIAVGAVDCGTPSAPVVSAQAVARGTVLTAEAAWDDVAQGCIQAAQAAGDDSIRAKCAAVLIPAHNVILAAANAVDAWTATDQNNFPCMARSALGALVAASQMVTSIGGTVPQVLLDAISLMNQYAPQCTVDAGTVGG